MNASPLPYDMGNAGDLIKHGIVAEFTQWWLDGQQGDFVFVDPFGGRPFAEPPHEKVIRRVEQLPDCALRDAQPDYMDRYYGSGNVVRNICRSKKRNARIVVSDRDPDALRDLLACGFVPLRWHDFDPLESFSIVNCVPAENHTRISLLLIDPFGDFLSDYARTVMPELANFVINNNVPVVLFVLCRDRGSQSDGETASENVMNVQWQRLRARYFTGRLTQVSLACRKIAGSRVKGEANLDAETVLLLPANSIDHRLIPLINRLGLFRDYLSSVLGQTIDLSVVS
ncbi:MAG: hypothetical protein PVJ39_12795 [Gammaproteobacteria bacterium]